MHPVAVGLSPGEEFGVSQANLHPGRDVVGFSMLSD